MGECGWGERCKYRKKQLRMDRQYDLAREDWLMIWKSYLHPISDIRYWNSNSRLELCPDFQRNEVWSKAAQITLIDTILKGIPIPQIYIKSIMNEGKTYRVVIDGQQRLTAILKFVENELPLEKPYSGVYSGKVFKVIINSEEYRDGNYTKRG